MTKSFTDYVQVDATALRNEAARAFEQAGQLSLAKRDLFWLNQLQFDPSVESVVLGEGWERLEALPKLPPVYKNERSPFFYLHRALTRNIWEFRVQPHSNVTVTIPLIDAPQWTLLRVHVGEAATVTFVDDQGNDFESGVPFRGVEVFVGANAKVRWHGYQHHDDRLVNFEHKRFVLEEGASLTFFQNILGGANSFEEAVVEMKGRGSAVNSQVVFFGRDAQRQELRFNHVHLGKDTVSHMVSKGAVQDSAYGGFLGYIQMEPGCSGADGNLEEHNLLLDDTAKIDATPGLEIGHNDVAAAHAAYMERVDDEKLFYLASRGIPKEEAIALIIEGFFLDAIEKMEDADLSSQIFKHLLMRLGK